MIAGAIYGVLDALGLLYVSEVSYWTGAMEAPVQ